MYKIIFDATMLAKYKKKNGERSGIFFTVYNILKNLQKHSEFDIYLYSLPENLLDVEEVQKELFPNLKFFQSPNSCQVKLLKIYQILDLAWNKFLKRPFYRKPIAFFRLIIVCLLRFFFSPKVNKLSQFQIFFSPSALIPNLIKRNKNIFKYLILYDVLPLILPQYKSQSGRIRKIINSLSLNEFYFCISKYTQQDFQKFSNSITRTNSAITYLAADKKFHQITDNDTKNKVLTKYHIPLNKKYIFSLCTLEPRKNLLRNIKTYLNFIEKNHIEDCVYILGGGQWVSFWHLLQKEVPNFAKYKQNIIYAGYIDDCDLPVLYSNAEWFVYTSQYEGFGLPPLEAMQCGCPVITSNNTSLPEVVGDAGIMIDWDSDEQHIEAYEKYYFDENLREINRKKGLERAKLFSWEKTVDKMVEVMRGNQ